jgi:multidrug efflux pump subunit AcrA (membrane-fusion protein)
MPSRAHKVAAAAAPVITVGLAVNLLGDDPATIALTATIEATQVDISPRITARIVERTVREGQPVERGQFLVRLDDQPLPAELGRAEATAARADSQLADLLAGSRRQEIEQARAWRGSATSRRPASSPSRAARSGR